jgi:hypothetical protein
VRVKKNYWQNIKSKFMNCPNCKNPVQESTTICEWCGHTMTLHSAPKESMATIHFYRSKFWGFAIRPKLYMNETLLTTIKSNWQYTIHIEREGGVTFWTKTEIKTVLNLDVELGKEYYIRCRIKPGILVGRFKLELIESNLAKKEMMNLEKENNNIPLIQ